MVQLSRVLVMFKYSIKRFIQSSQPHEQPPLLPNQVGALLTKHQSLLMHVPRSMEYHSFRCLCKLALQSLQRLGHLYSLPASNKSSLYTSVNTWRETWVSTALEHFLHKHGYPPDHCLLLLPVIAA